MKLQKYLLLAAAIVLLLPVLSSCNKKKKNDVTFDSFKGSLSFTLPSYVTPGEKHELKMSGVSKKDNSGFGCSWRVSLFEKSDTTRLESDPLSKSADYLLTIPDELTSFTVTCNVFANGYYGLSSSLSSTIVKSDKKNGSITGREFEEENDFIFTDPRDNKEYWCTNINGTDWFRENLAYGELGASYEDSKCMEDIFGGYYDWNEAQVACPQGWRLSSSEDWKALANYLTGKNFGTFDTFSGISGQLMANSYFNGERMWEFWPEINITDKSGLSVMPVGYGLKKDKDNDFVGYKKYATFWTSDERNEEQGIYRYLYVDKADCFLGTADKEALMASVRCVRDAEAI